MRLATIILVMFISLLRPTDALALSPDPVPIAYQAQTSCDPHAKPGTVAFSRLLMRKFGGGSLGITRSCGLGGVSEHKEGRAFDWALNAHKKIDRQRAARALKWLTEPVNGIDAYRAQRYGVMYVIWNGRMWRGYDVARGWAKYEGTNPHKDHVHFSLTWSGATKATSAYRQDPYFDYGPCVKWVGEVAPRWTEPHLEPCMSPLRRPSMNKRGMYEAQRDETVARIARWFDLDVLRLRRWNSWPSTGWVSIEVGQKVQVRR